MTRSLSETSENCTDRIKIVKSLQTKELDDYLSPLNRCHLCPERTLAGTEVAFAQQPPFPTLDQRLGVRGRRIEELDVGNQRGLTEFPK